MKRVGISQLRVMSNTHLAAMKEPVILCAHSEPIAAVVPYDLFMKWLKLIAQHKDGQQ